MQHGHANVGAVERCSEGSFWSFEWQVGNGVDTCPEYNIDSLPADVHDTRMEPVRVKP